MSPSRLLFIGTFLVTSAIQGALAADCFTNQERKEGDPSGAQITNALRKDNQIEYVCGGNWRLLDEQQVQNTFNHGCGSPILTILKD